MPRLLSAAPLRLVLAAVCVVVAVALLLAWRHEHDVTQAGDALAAGNPRAALRDTDHPSGTTAARAARLASLAQERLGNLPEAERAAARATAASPQDWSLRFDHAVLLQRLGRDASAQAEMNRALALNPRLVLPVGFVRGQ